MEIYKSKGSEKKENNKILDLFEKYHTEGRQSWSEIHKDFNLDKKFIQKGEQLTPTEIKKLKGRPQFVINKLIQFVKKVTNEMRQTDIAMKVDPIDSGADVPKAMVRKGVIQGIERTSNAEYAYQYAGEEAVTGGMGAFRINTKYVSDKSFDQTIDIKRILDASTVFYGPGIEPDYSDSRWCIIKGKGTGIEEGTELYNSINRDNVEHSIWGTDEKAYEYEFWCRKDTKDVLYTFKTGKNVFKSQVDPNAPDELFVMKDGKRLQRATTRKQWYQYKLRGREFVEPPVKWAGKWCPIVIVNGREVWIEGKRSLLSLCRYSKASQKLYNYARQEMARRLGLSPKVAWVAAIESIPKKFQDMWNHIHTRTYGTAYYNALDKEGKPLPAPTPPQIQPLDPALVTETQFSDNELKDTTGIQNENLGQGSNATSGKAILAKQREGDISTYDFQDNLAIAVQHCNRIVNDLIPKVIDTPRQVRMIGEDQSDKVIWANKDYTDKKSGEIKKDYYFSEEEEYDFSFKVGPSYESQREEDQAALMEIMKISPAAAEVLPYLVVKNLNFPAAQEASKMLKKMLPPGIVEPDEDDEEAQAPIPPEIQQKLQQAQEMEQAFQELQKENEQLKSKENIEREKIEMSREVAAAKNQVDEANARTKRLEAQIKEQEGQDNNVLEALKIELEKEKIKLEKEKINLEREKNKLESKRSEQEAKNPPPKEEPKEKPEKQEKLPDINVNVALTKMAQKKTASFTPDGKGGFSYETQGDNGVSTKGHIKKKGKGYVTESQSKEN